VKSSGVLSASNGLSDGVGVGTYLLDQGGLLSLAYEIDRASLVWIKDVLHQSTLSRLHEAVSRLFARRCCPGHASGILLSP